MDIETDNILIKGLKNGDKDSFEIIFRHYYTDLVNYCTRYIYDDAVAEEIIQDIFTKLWIKREEINVNVSLKSYLYKAVQNHAINYLNYIKQKEKYHQYLGFSTLHNYNTPLNKLQENDIKARLDKAILMMPEKCRKVFELKRFKDMKNKEIATQLGISIKTVEKHMSKAMSLLKNVLEDYIT